MVVNIFLLLKFNTHLLHVPLDHLNLGLHPAPLQLPKGEHVLNPRLVSLRITQKLVCEQTFQHSCEGLRLPRPILAVSITFRHMSEGNCFVIFEQILRQHVLGKHVPLHILSSFLRLDLIEIPLDFHPFFH